MEAASRLAEAAVQLQPRLDRHQNDVYRQHCALLNSAVAMAECHAEPERYGGGTDRL